MPIHIKHLPRKAASKGISSSQMPLDLCIDKETEIQGIGMGVLSDGTAFLNQRGLARLCGVMNAHIGTISTEWNDANQRPRITTVKSLLASRGITHDLPHIPVMRGNQIFFAYPDTVCLAILEYYAFEAGTNYKEEARKNFRVLAGKALQDFIYTQVGYSPAVRIPLAWQQFHDRVSLVYDSVPLGYFSVFKEIADMVVTLIRGGAMFGPDFVPDISVGQHWAQHWDNALEHTYGARAKYEHNYPHYFPQASSNPQAPYCYPNEALGEFRRWMWDVYLPTKLPGYLAKKESQGILPASFSKLALKAFQERGDAKRIESATLTGAG